ncbi:OmpA family protein [Alkalimonas collagenimarina]|uniref:OmpA family protein n=1 Tax=Alkalimonas collagenimarina TaxID=400390 RepID=A0ABT9GU53_9GAMM|nr:OmpA family protein [Alkalimonas collagenimarina]MDP4534584.1 OmpA family protein [Alkalimonas collagenimarina]
MTLKFIGRGVLLACLVLSVMAWSATDDPRERPIVHAEPPVVVDSDGDGIPDECDRCPNTPEGDRVDSFGCSIFEEDQVVLEIDILFDFDQHNVKPMYYDQVEQLADYLKRFVNTRVLIAGHTDDRGSYEYNQGLSERRAKAVADLLVNRFAIESGRISTQGYGKTQPRASGVTDADRAQNRRIEAIVEPAD